VQQGDGHAIAVRAKRCPVREQSSIGPALSATARGIGTRGATIALCAARP
jgi:hypothetical protein